MVCSRASKEKENVCEKRFALKRKEEGMLCYTFFFPFFSYILPSFRRSLENENESNEGKCWENMYL